ncbi:MAG: hypothetical protein QF902_10470, partial [Rhodospirillales bacterium]|nr:hypothetical protein [Rhodospirillales bacterium]
MIESAPRFGANDTDAKRPPTRRVFANVYLLIAIAVITSAAAIAIIQWSDARNSVLEDRASGFHLASVAGADRIEREIFLFQRKELERALLVERKTRPQSSGLRDLDGLREAEFAATLHVIEGEIVKLRSLQD